jgi:3-hydroxy-5-phosphonooxypentane-2,4-dione thiolase
MQNFYLWFAVIGSLSEYLNRRAALHGIADTTATKKGNLTMADLDGTNEAKNFHLSIQPENKPFFLKGSNALGWGIQNRLARIFSPASARTVMLAIDHGYFQGPTTGLERIDINILPLLPYADALMLTRGILRTTIPSSFGNGIVLRASGGPSVLKELSNEQIAMDMEDAIRLNTAAVAVQVYIGGEYETQTVHNMTRLVDSGNRYGVPVLGVTAVGRDMVRDARYIRLACRICAELGAHIVKTYYIPEGFETVTASCPVPIVMAGGKKLPELDALVMAYKAVEEGAAGVDMGRNIFQSEAPVAMIQAVRHVVHERMKPEHAYELYQTLKNENRQRGA